MEKKIVLARPHPFVVAEMRPFLAEGGFTVSKPEQLADLPALLAGAAGAVISLALSSSILATAEEVFEHLRRINMRLPDPQAFQIAGVIMHQSADLVARYLGQASPADEFNQELVRNTRPPDWINPLPSEPYNLVIIGAGTAGLVTAAGAAGLGAKVALIESSLMGGDCLNTGCVPSKAILSAARAAAMVRNAGAYGMKVPEGLAVDFAAVMARMRRLRAGISRNDGAARFRELGVDVFFGHASFVDSNTVDVDGTRLTFKRAVIATGARAAAPPIPGLAGVEYLTNESLFSLTTLPPRLGIVGAGPIGCEMAQAFAQLGSSVFLVHTDSGILPREDRDATRIVQAALARDGVRMLGGSEHLQIHNELGIHLTVAATNSSYDVTVDKLLVAVGRAPNVENLNLQAVGVEFDAKGVKVNNRMQTSNPMIYAAGDICSPYQFTHAADFMARIVIQNALFNGRKRSTSLVIPWCTYTSPEIAHVGLNEGQAAGLGIAIDTYVEPLRHNDRAILEGEEEGFVKVHAKKGTDTLVGATIVARNAGDLISELTLAMTHGLGLKQIGSTIHPYPTQAEAIRRLGDQYNRSRMTPLVKKLFRLWLGWGRRGL